MYRKLLVNVVVVLAVLFSGSAIPSFAKPLADDLALYNALPGARPVLKEALSIVKKNQKQKHKRLVRYTGPRDMFDLSERYLAVSFNAGVKKIGSARNKVEPAIYALLFEKSVSGELNFFKHIYLTWFGATDIEDYKTMKLTKLAEYYRKQGAEFVYYTEKKKKKKAQQSIDASLIKSGILKERYIDSALTRDEEMRGILSGYMKKDSPAAEPLPEQRIAELEARIEKLEALLLNVTRNGNDIIFKRVNVHIQNGTGKTEKVNGTGNLIVGYGSSGIGSHNIAVGSKNKYSSCGNILSGANNVSAKKYSLVAGGRNNKSAGDYAVILGGHDNYAKGEYSSVLGGSDNKAKGQYSSINGQRGRTKVDAGKNKHFKK